MLLADVVAASTEVGATRSRKAKVVALAALLERVADADPEEVRTVTSYLAGSLRQRRTGLGWRSVATLPPPAPAPSLTVAEVHAAFESMAALSGPGSSGARAAAAAELFGRATAEEQPWLRALVTGEVRQGALDSLVQEGLAAAGGVPLAALRRAAMMAGSTVAIAPAALTGGDLDAFTLTVMRPVQPMLASSATTVAAAIDKAGPPVAIDTKLDGIRVQVHRSGSDVVIATRSLEVITDRLPEVVEVALALPASSFVLDGEVLALDDAGRPRPFQETASRTAMAHLEGGVHLTPYFFDLLHLDGTDLVDAPLSSRLEALSALVPPEHLVARLTTSDVAEADAFVVDVLDRGHEGVVVKHLAAPYDAGRRGSAWVKVKPVHTLDLVVLAVEWGSGRREGWLSNIHLGARSDASETGFVMLGKTFKGMTDEMLTWQTDRFLELETHREGHVVHVRPEQVVEIAFDGLQRSTRYPGGLALRFARVLRYRDDKTAGDADTIETVRTYAAPADPPAV